MASAIVCGCESGSSEGPEPISFTPAPPPAGTGFVALYAPPVDVVPYPNDLYNPTGTRLAVPVKVTSPLVAALNTLDGFSTTAVISAPFNAPLDPASLIPWNPLSMAPGRRVDHRAQRNGRHAARARDVHYTVRVSTAAGSGGEPARDRAVAPACAAHAVRVHRDESRAQHGRRRGQRRYRVRRRARRAPRGPNERAEVHRSSRRYFPRSRRSSTRQLASGCRATASSSRGACRRSRSATCSTSSTRTATPRPAVLVSAGITTAQLGLGLPGIASIYTGFIEVAVLRRPGESADELLGELGALAAERAEPDADPARAEPAHSAARDAAERRQRPHAAGRRAGPS